MSGKQTFVLIHGAWHGGWCWNEVKRRLELEGHTVFAPTLPGHAERAAEQPISLERYVSDLHSSLRLKRIENATIVGHSMAGVLLPALVNRLPGAFKTAVLVAAFVLSSGEAMTDYFLEPTREFYHKLLAERNDNRIALPDDVAMRALYNRCGPEIARDAVSRMTPQPYAPFKEKTPAGYDALDTLRRAVILATDDRAMPRETWMRFSERARPDAHAEVDADHMMMISNPDSFVEKLLEVSA